MENSDKDLQKASDIKQMAIIGKIHNMQWLKNNSQLSGLTKPLPDASELTDNTIKSNINEEAKERIEVASTNIVSTSSEIDQVKNISTIDLNEDNSITNKEELHSSVEVIDLPQEKMETVWNKDVDVPSTLFPNSQSLVMQRLDEQERISMTLAESIVTVQLDQFRLNEEEENKPNDSHNEADNEWDTVNHISDLPKSDNDIGNQINPKECHDNNNNNAKSKSQSVLETKKNVQKTTKLNTKKLNEQKTKKQSGNSLKEPFNISKQGSKSKDDLLNLSNDENKTSTSSGESKKISVAISSKFIDKYSNKVNEYNKQSIMGKGTRTKEQQVFKPHFSTLNDSGNSSKSSIEGFDDRTKCVSTKLKVSRNESDKKGNELDDTRRCHKVQVTRTQSYNVQYNRSKPLIKSQQRYVKNVSKPDEANSIKNTSSFNTTASISTENSSKKRCENQQSVINKQISDMHSTQNISGKSIKNPNVPDCSISERSSAKSNSVPCKRNYQNLGNIKHTVERNVKDDQTHTQKFKRDSNIYRRSSFVVPTFSKDLSGQAKPEDHKKNVTENYSSKDYKVKPISTVDAKVHCESEGSRVSVHPHKTSNGASNTKKTDTLDSSTLNNVQSVKSLNSCSNNTKDSTTVNVSQELQVSQVSCNKTEVQFVKTEQENTNNNNSNNKTSTNNSDTKSVKFSDNVQEINVTHQSRSSYSDTPIYQNKINPINSFYSNLQNTSNTSNAQQMENHQSVQNKSYFDNNNAQYSNTNTNIQHTERDLHLLDVVQQKPEQTTHMSPQNVLPQNNGNAATITMGNRIPYQSMPAMYLSQYNNTQNVPRKTADSTICSQNALISSTSSYNVESQNVLHNDTSNILMHNTQTSVLPPPGFHNHPITTQHNQWNLPLPDMFLFGNMMNSAPPMNMPIQNSRHVCSTDFNNMQQTGYLQQPMYYVPSVCMQSWNPLLQYPAPLFQNPSYANCNTYPSQVLSSNNLVDSVNCPVTTSIQNNTYKHFQPVQHMENPPNFSVPVKLDNYMGNVQGCKSNIRVKDNQMEAHMRANQYRAPVPNDYQNCSPDGQLMLPFSYGIAMDPMARNCSPNMHVHINQKYAPHALTTANYQRMPETCSAFQNNQDSNNRKDDVSKNDSECIPPMVSPRECMYYGVNYSRKTDNVQNSSLRSDVKPIAYNIHSVNTQHYVPQYQRNTTYQNTSPKELTSRVTTGRGVRKTMDQ